MTIKQFETAVKAKREPKEGEVQLEDLDFELDGVKYVVSAPKDAQLAWLVAAGSAHRSDADRVAALLDFFEQALQEPGRSRFRERMLNPKDLLDLAKCIEIFEWMLGKWGGRPPT